MLTQAQVRLLLCLQLLVLGLVRALDFALETEGVENYLPVADVELFLEPRKRVFELGGRIQTAWTQSNWPRRD